MLQYLQIKQDANDWKKENKKKKDCGKKKLHPQISFVRWQCLNKSVPPAL